MNRTRDILDALISAVDEQVARRNAALLFSGGLDSSVLAAIMVNRSSLTLYTVGIDKSHDLVVAEETAALLDLPWVGLVVDEDDIMRSIILVSRLISTKNPLTISFEMPLCLVSERVKEVLLVCGQGADELFGGYARYLRMSSDQLRMSMKGDLTRLIDVGLKNERRIADQYGKELLHPFLHPGVVDCAKAIPAEEHIQDGVRKVVLRDVGLSLGLGEIAMREKKAAQYGSGIMKVMKAAARRKGMALAPFIEDIVSKGESP
ncbi:MAG: asparagine synthase-related protein [Methanomassiliicoccales archaeon]|nr:asparagine synthase-related protein [Methanomassiliicoccales archaeon]